MSDSSTPPNSIAAASRRLAGRIVSTGSNRLELLVVELEEERDHLVRSAAMAIFAGVFVLLGLMAFSGAIVVWLWAKSPLLVLLGLAVLYSAIGYGFYQKLLAMQRDWRSFGATLDQIQKDFAAVEKKLTS